MNQKSIDDEHYLSEDKIICRKGRTEVYILTMSSLNIYGPKQYKFGDSDKNYYFALKTNAKIYQKRLIIHYKRLMKIESELKKGREIDIPSIPKFRINPEKSTLSEQILKIKTYYQFKLWLYNNRLIYDIVCEESKYKLIVKKKGSIIASIYLEAELRSLPKCCGGKEFCYHFGGLTTKELSITMDHWRILAKYFAIGFDEKLESGKFGHKGGEYYISYIRRPGSIEDPSARWGEILSNSKYFKKAGNFTNVNTGANLDVYVSSQAYVNLYNK